MGVTFGRYEIIRRVATGGMAEIFLARERRIEGFERPVVIKKVLPHLAKDKDLTEMFLQEARTAALLEHSNIVRIYDLGQERGIFYIVMEYIHGETLSEIWKRGVQQKKLLPLPYTLQLLADAAKGLDYAHKRRDLSNKPLNIVHRDVSPQNIMASFEGLVKVVDFGIAKAANKLKNTNAGVIKGKFAYMAPEQARGEAVDARSDIFALGILLYELTTGKRLFRAPSDIQTIQKVAACEIAPPSARIPQYPKGLEQIVMKTLAAKPEDRFADAKEFSDALEGYIRERRLDTRGFTEYLRGLFPEHQALDLSPNEQDANDFLLSVAPPPPPRPAEDTPSNQGLFVPSQLGIPIVKEQGGAAMQVLLEAETPAASSPAEPPKKSEDPTVPKAELAGRLSPPPLTPPPVPPAADATPPPRIPLPPEDSSEGSSRTPTGKGERQSAEAVDPLVEALGLKPRPRSSLPWAALAVALVLVVGLSAALLWPGEPAKVAGDASIEIRSSPSQAQIYLDDSKLPDVTPAKLTGLSPGVPYTLKVVKEGFFPEKKTVTIDAKIGVAAVDITLRPAERGRLNLESVPPGASITLDGEDTGKRTPAPLYDITAGEEHVILLEKQGYLPKELRFTLAPNEQKTLKEHLEAEKVLDMSQAGSLSVTCACQPVGPVVVALDGKEIAKVPPGVEKILVPAGPRQLTLTDKKGTVHQFAIEIPVGGELNLSYELKDGKLVPF